METLKFKTTIKCFGCIVNVTPVLDEAAGKENWEVDIQNPDKILTIKPEARLKADEVIKAVESAGYKAQKIS